MKQHLAKCTRWVNSLPETVWESLKAISHDPQRRITEMSPVFQKKTIPEINRLVGMAIFAGARPFSLFESIEMKALLQALNPNYKPPSRNQLSTTILEDCYAQVKLDVEKQISRAQYLNVSVDESTDIRKRRIANISVTDGRRSYCIASRDIGDTSMSAIACADWIQEQVKHLRPQFIRIVTFI